jgi:penicillin-binding protein 1A
MDGLGRIRSMIGGADYQAGPFNHATDAHRQAGSSWKPFVYLAAMENGLTPDSPVVDEPVTINGWTPANYEPEYLGPITLETALAHSINTVAARLADQVGRPVVAADARRLGITTPINTDPAMALGTSLVTPLEMAQAYDAFANGGNRISAYGLDQIRLASGQVLYQHPAPGAVQAIQNPPLGELDRMLRTVITAGTGTRAAIPGYDLAGKTGTTSDYKDAWFCGFTGGLVTVVWVGRDDATPMVRITGNSAPLDLWRGYMIQALKRLPTAPIPPGPPPPAPVLPVAADTPGAPSAPGAPTPTQPTPATPL